MKVKSLSRVQFLATPWTAAYQAPPPGIFQARVLEWGAIAFSGRRYRETDKLVCICVREAGGGRNVFLLTIFIECLLNIL